MPKPNVEASTSDVTPSKIPFVIKYVWSPCKALLIGPRMDNVPIQNKRIAVDH